MIDDAFFCECCNDLCQDDLGNPIETDAGIQAVCPDCYEKYLKKKNKRISDYETTVAVEIEIGHIEELYGRDGLILAMELLKKILDKE